MKAARKAGGRKTRRNMRGGGLREDALAYLKREGKEPSQLLFELHKRNPNGSYTATTKKMGGFTFKKRIMPMINIKIFFHLVIIE
jgi:hypothetical protein